MSENVWPTQSGTADIPEEEFARRCTQLLDDPVLAAAMNAIDSAAVQQWRRSGSTLQREEAWHKMIAVTELRNALKRVLDNVALEHQRLRRAGIRRD